MAATMTGDVQAHHLPFALSALSRRRLLGVHPDLIRCVERAIQITEVDFLVVEGVRDVERQKLLVANGASTTMNSRHLTGHAVDLCAIRDGRLLWGQPQADQVARAMQDAAKEFGIALEWGGDWTSFVDTPHFQLSWSQYPRQDETWKEVPKPKPKPDEIAKAMKKSRKYSVAGFWKWLLAFLGVSSPVTWEGTKVGIAAGGEIAETVQSVAANYGFLMFAGVCIAGAIVLNWLQGRQKDDYEDGRYTPSGMDQ